MTSKPKPEIDPNTKIPPAVKRAAELAEQTHKNAYKKEGEPASEPAPTPEPTPEPAPVVTPPSNPEPAPTPEPAPAPAPEVDWERRYKSMEGRYKRAENDIRAMSDQIASMQSLLANVQAPPASTPPELQARSLLTPEEVNEYGSEFLGVVAKKAKEELTPLEQKIAQLEKRLEGQQQSSSAKARADLEATLDRDVPNWRDVNVAPEFHSWLALPDLFSGAIRHQLLTTAYEQNNTPRVLAFFKGFLSEEAATAPHYADPAPVDAPSDKIPLEQFAAPGRAKTAAAPSSAPAEKPSFTRATIAKFYADSAAGKYRGKEAEKNRIEAQIFEAEREGRIR